MKTKDKILSAALELYNKNGYNSTSTRDIAKYLNISPGNLHYHFSHTNQIITDLFSNFLSKINNLLDIAQKTEPKNLESLHQYISSSAEIFYSYKFLFINFVDILKQNPNINELYKEINLKRKAEYESLFKSFQEHQIFRKDIPDFILETIVDQMFIIGDNSISYNELIKQLDYQNAINFYTKIFMNQFYFFLTEEQQAIYSKNYK